MLWILGVVGFIGVISFAISGIFYLVAFGDTDMLIKAKKSLKYSVIGIVISISGLVFLQVERLMNQNSYLGYSENTSSQSDSQINDGQKSDSLSVFPIVSQLSTDTNNNKLNPDGNYINNRTDVQYEDPRLFGEIKIDILSVKSADIMSFSDGSKRLVLSGIGLPDTAVHIYIFSKLPLILSTVTDSKGNWSYVLENQIDDGQHQVYVAVTDSQGKITAKSEPLFFVKTADAIAIISPAEASEYEMSSPPLKKRLYSDLFMLSGIIILGFIMCLAVIGLFIIKKVDNKEA